MIDNIYQKALDDMNRTMASDHFIIRHLATIQSALQIAARAEDLKQKELRNKNEDRT